MKIEVDIDDYLDHEEKSRIARDAFALACKNRSNKDFERIIDNAAYSLVQREVDKCFDGNMAEVIKEKAVVVIGKLSDFQVFRRPDQWSREVGPGWGILTEAIKESSGAIKDRVSAIINQMDEQSIRDMIEAEVIGAIVGKLTA